MSNVLFRREYRVGFSISYRKSPPPHFVSRPHYTLSLTLSLRDSLDVILTRSFTKLRKYFLKK